MKELVIVKGEARVTNSTLEWRQLRKEGSVTQQSRIEQNRIEMRRGDISAHQPELKTSKKGSVDMEPMVHNGAERRLSCDEIEQEQDTLQ